MAGQLNSALGNQGILEEEESMGLPQVRVYAHIPNINQSSVVEVNFVRDGILIFGDPILSSIRKHGKECYFQAEFNNSALDGLNKLFHNILDGSQQNFRIHADSHNNSLNIDNIFSGENNVKIAASGNGFNIDLIADNNASRRAGSVAGALMATAMISTRMSVNDDVHAQNDSIFGSVNGGDIEAELTVKAIGDHPLALPDNNNIEFPPAVAFHIPGASLPINWN